MGAITALCGQHFPTMTAYVRHLPRCPRCIVMMSARKPR
jgi:hypothetical protein